jgi:hypothetical protein
VNIRQNFIRILERYGVDMILCGHSHDYERSYLMRGYFGNEASFSQGTHAVSNSSGKYDGTANSCAYQVAGGQVNHGTVYVVSGSAGASGGVQSGYPHNAMPYSFNVGGMFYFEVEDNRLDAKFLRYDGVVADQFTIMKDAGQAVTVVSQSGEPVTLTASWIGNYQWSTGATTRSITVSPLASTLYSCTDGLNCLTDQFDVQVAAVSPAVTRLGSNKTQAGQKDKTWTLYPTPVKRGTAVTLLGKSGATMQIEVMNEQGKGMVRATARGNYALSTGRFTPGVYFVRVISEGEQSVKKLVVE